MFIKKSLLLSLLLTVYPATFATETTEPVPEQTNQQEITYWTFNCSFQKTSFTEENWAIALEKMNDKIQEISQENLQSNPMDATIAFIKELFELSTETAIADDEHKINIIFTIHKVNDEDQTSWNMAQEIAQTMVELINEEVQSYDVRAIEILAPHFYNLQQLAAASESIEGSIAIQLTNPEAK